MILYINNTAMLVEGSTLLRRALHLLC